MEYKVKKGVSKEPLLWGMKIPQFIAFISILIVNAFFLASGLSIKKLLVAISITTISYLILKATSSKNIIRIFFSDSFPESVKNDLNK